MLIHSRGRVYKKLTSGRSSKPSGIRAAFSGSIMQKSSLESESHTAPRFRFLFSFSSKSSSSSSSSEEDVQFSKTKSSEPESCLSLAEVCLSSSISGADSSEMVQQKNYLYFLQHTHSHKIEKKNPTLNHQKSL